MTTFGAIQDYIGRDGRSKMLAILVERLNRRGIVPDILTFSEQRDAEDFRSIAEEEIEFELVMLPRKRVRLGHIFTQMSLPFLVRDRLPAYDIVFASDTAVYGYPPDVPLIRLVCFPLEQIPRYEARYRRVHYRLWGCALGGLQGLARRRTAFHGTWIAISEFTRRAMLESYPLERDEIAVLYPPVRLAPEMQAGAREREVVSLARFHSDKRQLEQIELARRIPDARFCIAGSVRWSGYYERCAVAAAPLANVELLPDATAEQIDLLLGRAKVFLHSKRYEHFGLSTVEAVARGCVPVVHDSGGQRETVPPDELRFTDEDEAVEILRAALDGEFDHLLPELQEHVRQFAKKEFVARLDVILDAALGASVDVH